jgi:DnaJ-class molecular chaperone
MMMRSTCAACNGRGKVKPHAFKRPSKNGGTRDCAICRGRGYLVVRRLESTTQETTPAEPGKGK